MALRKHGTGQILKEEEPKTDKDWTAKDEAELSEENKFEEQD